MIRWPLIIAVALIACWDKGFAETMAQAQRPSSATVLSIGDGDTIRVQQGAKRITIRLACIDAPEMAQAPDGAKARSYLQSRLRLGSSVTLRPLTVDRFGRTVAEVIGEAISTWLWWKTAWRSPIGGIWATATPGSISMPKSGRPAAASGCGGCRAASPAPGTSAAAIPCMRAGVVAPRSQVLGWDWRGRG